MLELVVNGHIMRFWEIHKMQISIGLINVSIMVVTKI